MKNTLKTNALKGVLFAASLFASAAFCEVSYGSLTDMRDGKTYRTVKIGTQTWMAENLNYAYIPDFLSFCYDDSEDSCAKYGRLYTWTAAIDSAAVFGEGGKGCGFGKTCSPTYPVRGVCPDGWHLPSVAEWNTLKRFVAKSLFGDERNFDSVGYALKSTSGWLDNGNGSDSFGFGALPTGFCDDCSHSPFEGAYFWSANGYDRDDAWIQGLRYSGTGLSTSNSDKLRVLSVRCVKDSFLRR